MTSEDERPIFIRKGAVMRVAPPGQRTWAQVYADLQFPDGRIERWLGPSNGSHEPVDPVAYGRQTTDEQAIALLADYGIAFGNALRQSFADAPVEIVIERHDSDSRS